MPYDPNDKVPCAAPPENGDVTQSQNIALGDIAGGGIDKSVHHHGDIILKPSETPLARLYRELREEASGDQALTDYIAQLKIFTRIVENEEVVGLDEKLQSAGRDDQLRMAKQLKEMIYAQLRENMFSRTFQTIYATLLGKIFEQFDVYVRPAIASGVDREAVDVLVHENVVMPVVAELERCPDCNDAPVQTVKGMIYFLTGNCHIRWH